MRQDNPGPERWQTTGFPLHQIVDDNQLRAAKDLIISLLQAHPKVLVQDWWKDGQTRQRVKAEIEMVLDQDLPDSYGRVEFKEKCDKVFDLVVEFAAHKRKWAA